MNKIENSKKTLHLMYYKMFKTVFEKNPNILLKIIQVTLNESEEKFQLKKCRIVKNDLEENSPYLSQFTIYFDKSIPLTVNVDYLVYPNTSKLNYTFSLDIHSKNESYQISLNNFPNLNDQIIHEFYFMKSNSSTNVLAKEYSMIQVDIKKCYENFKSAKKIEELSSLERLGACLYATSPAEISLILGNNLIKKEEKEKFINDIITSSEDEIIKLQQKIVK